VTIGCRHFTVRCRNCGFTHFYKFDLEYISKDELTVGQDSNPAS
jgi:predicted nucleic-acid-binding Zn-ribbon protein